MKDGTSGMSIKGSVVLKSKMDTFITEDNNACKKGKGCDKNVADYEL